MKLQVLHLLLGMVICSALPRRNIINYKTNHMGHQQKGVSGKAVVGRYSWRAPNGQKFQVSYTADRRGYRIINKDHDNEKINKPRQQQNAQNSLRVNQQSDWNKRSQQRWKDQRSHNNNRASAHSYFNSPTHSWQTNLVNKESQQSISSQSPALSHYYGRGNDESYDEEEEEEEEYENDDEGFEGDEFETDERSEHEETEFDDRVKTNPRHLNTKLHSGVVSNTHNNNNNNVATSDTNWEGSHNKLTENELNNERENEGANGSEKNEKEKVNMSRLSEKTSNIEKASKTSLKIGSSNKGPSDEPIKDIDTKVKKENDRNKEKPTEKGKVQSTSLGGRNKTTKDQSENIPESKESPKSTKKEDPEFNKKERKSEIIREETSIAAEVTNGGASDDIVNKNVEENWSKTSEHSEVVEDKTSETNWTKVSKTSKDAGSKTLKTSEATESKAKENEVLEATESTDKNLDATIEKTNLNKNDKTSQTPFPSISKVSEVITENLPVKLKENQRNPHIISKTTSSNEREWKEVSEHMNRKHTNLPEEENTESTKGSIRETSAHKTSKGIGLKGNMTEVLKAVESILARDSDINKKQDKFLEENTDKVPKGANLKGDDKSADAVDGKVADTVDGKSFAKNGNKVADMTYDKSGDILDMKPLGKGDKSPEIINKKISEKEPAEAVLSDVSNLSLEVETSKKEIDIVSDKGTEKKSEVEKNNASQVPQDKASGKVVDMESETMKDNVPESLKNEVTKAKIGKGNDAIIIVLMDNNSKKVKDIIPKTMKDNLSENVADATSEISREIRKDTILEPMENSVSETLVKDKTSDAVTDESSVAVKDEALTPNPSSEVNNQPAEIGKNTGIEVEMGKQLMKLK